MFGSSNSGGGLVYKALAAHLYSTILCIYGVVIRELLGENKNGVYMEPRELSLINRRTVARPEVPGMRTVGVTC